MAHDVECVTRRSNSNEKRSWRSLKQGFRICAVFLTLWAFVGILCTDWSSSMYFRKAAEGNEVMESRAAGWSDPDQANNKPKRSPAEKDERRETIKMILSSEYFRTKDPLDVYWKDLFLQGFDVKSAQKFSLLLRELRLPNGRIMHCNTDETLDPIPDNVKRIFIASNQHDSQAVLPNFIKQVMDVLLDNPEKEFFVSMYESGSSDGTPHLLHLFADVLEELDVPNEIVANGTLTRTKNQPRIDFLAQVRNKALEPLLKQATKGYFFDRVLFINDVYFCAGDLHRVLLHDADIACGMDFLHHRVKKRGVSAATGMQAAAKRSYYQERLMDNHEIQKAVDLASASRKWNDIIREKRNPDSWMVFYDIWVAHDSAGRHFENLYPYVRNGTYEHYRLQRGLPFPGECCWNGIVNLTPEPFLQGVKFRMAAEDECQTSECVLLCHDFHRIGYRRVIIDPALRMTYEYSDARVISVAGINGLPKASWKTVKEAEPMRDKHIIPGQLIDCCGLLPGFDYVDFDSCQRDYNLWNVTSASERLAVDIPNRSFG